MSEFTVRLKAAANITQRSRESLRNGQKSADEPWYQDAFPEGQHRRYNGEHLLRLIIMEMLVKQGCEMALAAEFVRTQGGAVTLFLDEVEKFQPITGRFVWGLQVADEDSWTGTRFTPHLHLGAGTCNELVAHFQSALLSIGKIDPARDGRSETRHIGGPWVAVASIPEAYRILKLRAADAKFVVDGIKILPFAESESQNDGDEADS